MGRESWQAWPRRTATVLAAAVLGISAGACGSQPQGPNATDPVPHVTLVPSESPAVGGPTAGAALTPTPRPVATPSGEPDQVNRVKVEADKPWKAQSVRIPGRGTVRITADGTWTVTGTELFTKKLQPFTGSEGLPPQVEGDRTLDEAPWGALIMKLDSGRFGETIQQVTSGKPFRMFAGGGDGGDSGGATLTFAINDTPKACKKLTLPGSGACTEDNKGELTLKVEYWSGIGPGGAGPAADVPPIRQSGGRSR